MARLLLGVSAAALAAGLLAGGLAWHEGYRVYAVRTGSMTPSLSPGDLILDAPAVGPYAKGEVVTFQVPTSPNSDPVVTHRVYQQDGEGSCTKGDANRTPDIHPVTEEDVVGEVVGVVPNGGYALVYLSQLTGVLSLILSSASIWFAWSLFYGGRPRQTA